MNLQKKFKKNNYNYTLPNNNKIIEISKKLFESNETLKSNLKKFLIIKLLFQILVFIEIIILMIKIYQMNNIAIFIIAIII